VSLTADTARTARLQAMQVGLEDSYGVPARSLATIPAFGDTLGSRWAPRDFEPAGNTRGVPLGNRRVFGGLRDSGVFACPLFPSSESHALTYDTLFESCGLVRYGSGKRWRVDRHCKSQTLRLHVDDYMHEITGAYGAVSFAASQPGDPVYATFRMQGRYHNRLQNQPLPPALGPADSVKFCGAGFTIDPDNAAEFAPVYQGFDVSVATRAEDQRPNSRAAGSRLKVLGVTETWSVDIEEMGYDFDEAFRAQRAFALSQNLSGWKFSCPAGREWVLISAPSYSVASSGIMIANLVFGLRGRKTVRLEVGRV
jgi:hypothetical protein